MTGTTNDNREVVSNENSPLMSVNFFDVVKSSMSKLEKKSENMRSSGEGFAVGYKSFIESKLGITLAIASVVIYYALAIIAYGHIFEHWSYIDCLYFATLTFTTIGYGDISPASDSARLFTIFFSLYGIFILGYFAGLAGEKLVDLHNDKLEKMKKNARNQATDIIFEDDDTFVEKGETNYTNKTNEEQTETTHQKKYRVLRKLIWDMISIQVPLMSLLLLLGVLYGTVFEHWTVIESLYFTILTFSTVGYGDYAPTESWIRLSCVIFLPFCAFLFCDMIARIASVYMHYNIHKQEEEYLNRHLTLMDLELMDTDGDGNVDFGEFLCFMLKALHKVSEEDIDELRELFDKLDVNKDKTLDIKDLRGTTARRSLRLSMIRGPVFQDYSALFNAEDL